MTASGWMNSVQFRQLGCMLGENWIVHYSVNRTYWVVNSPVRGEYKLIVIREIIYTQKYG